MRTYRARSLTTTLTTAAGAAVVTTAVVVSAALPATAGAASSAGPVTAALRVPAAGDHTPLPTSGQRAGSLLDRRIAGSAAGHEPRGSASTRLPVSGPVNVMLELDVAPSATAYATAMVRGKRAAVGAGRAQRSRVLSSQRRLLAAFSHDATAARMLYRTTAVYSGIAVATDARRLAALGALPGVKAVHLLTPKRLANAETVPLIGTQKVWQSTNTGKGVRIGIIDTGIDYTHADFGGAGTAESYTAARSSSTQPPAYPVGGNVVGGVDLAGDNYDSAALLANGEVDPARTKPLPDANPLDCEGHGTHVAGTAGGLGVTTAGATYRGPYTVGLAPTAFRIGPGVAPGASLYAIRVFGCTGSTDLVAQGLDWAADPNRDGDVSDRLDVVNLSLGGDFGSAQDPDSVASDNLAMLGTVVVAAAGNAGDVQDAVGSPGNATRAIAVAASDDPAAVVDGLRVDAPAGLEPNPSLDGAVDNVFGAQQSAGDSTSGIAPYPWATGGVVATSLVTIGSWASAPGASNNSDGCSAYSAAEAAAVAGKVVLLRWTDVGQRRCGSAARGANAVAAGAVGVVLGDDVNSFSAGIAGDPRLPMMLVIKQGTDALKQAIDRSGNNGSVKVSLTDDYQGRVRIDLAGTSSNPIDRVASFSSRGYGTSLAVKPDVTAPGVTVFSANVGTGSAGVSDSGTSMASPHVAGVAALVRAAHPAWSVEQVKAAIMGTAGVRVMTEVGGPLTEGPARAGSGRVQADRAVSTTTLAYNSDGAGSVGLSFGDVAVTKDTAATRGLRVENLGTTAARYALTYTPVVSTPGVSFSVSPTVVTVPAHSSVTAVLTMRLTPAAMRRTLDPTMSTTEGLRSYYSDAGGSVTVAGGNRLVNVPVYAAPRPASAMTSAGTALVGSTGKGKLDLVGQDLLQGSGGDVGSDPTVYASTVTALMLQGTSARGADCSRTVLVKCTPFPDDRAGDLRYVGVASDIPYARDAFNQATGADNGYAYFGVTAWGPWHTPASYAEFDFYIDTNPAVPGPELLLFNSRLTPDTDIMVSTLGDLRTGQIIDQEPLNGALGSLDTGLFHSDSMVLPLWLPAMLPYLPKKADGTLASTRIGYWVKAGTVESGVTDGIASSAKPLSVDLRSPALRADGSAKGPSLNDDAPGARYRLTVTRDLTKVAADAPRGLMLVHHQNVNGSRTQVVQVRGATSTSLTTTPASFRYGGRPLLTASVRQASRTAGGPTGTVTFRDGSVLLGTAPLTRARATLRPAGLVRGSHAVTATYDGDPLSGTSTSAVTRLTVTGRPTTTTVLLSAASVGYGGRPTLRATLTPVAAFGTVTLREGDALAGPVLGRADVVAGSALLKVPVLARGSHVLWARYDGSSAYAPSSGWVRLRIT